MCPFSCVAGGSGPTVYKALAIALLAGAIGVVHSMASPLKLTVDAPTSLDSLLISKGEGNKQEIGTPTRNARLAPTPPLAPAPNAGEAGAEAAPNPSDQRTRQPAPTPMPPVESTPTLTGHPAPAPPTTPTNAAQPTKAGDASMITVEQARTLFERVNSAGDVSFVDARNPEEFVTGRIPSAVNMPPSLFIGGQVPPDLAMIPTSNIIVVYCNGGDCDASKLTAIRLREQGYQNVFVFEEGMTGWTAAKLPIEK